MLKVETISCLEKKKKKKKKKKQFRSPRRVSLLLLLANMAAVMLAKDQNDSELQTPSLAKRS